MITIWIDAHLSPALATKMLSLLIYDYYVKAKNETKCNFRT